jgi:hypothetical protein
MCNFVALWDIKFVGIKAKFLSIQLSCFGEVIFNFSLSRIFTWDYLVSELSPDKIQPDPG